MKKNNELELLTIELYESLTSEILDEVVELKHQQEGTLNNILIKKEILKEVKIELKKLNKKIKAHRRELRLEKRNLSRINSDLDNRQKMMVELNENICLQQDTYVNLDEYYGKLKTKKIN